MRLYFNSFVKLSNYGNKPRQTQFLVSGKNQNNTVFPFDDVTLFGFLKYIFYRTKIQNIEIVYMLSGVFKNVWVLLITKKVEWKNSLSLTKANTK